MSEFDAPTSDEPVHPRAYSWRVMKCGDPNCHPHLVFLDESGNIICDAVIGDYQIDSLYHQLQHCSAVIKQGRH